MIRVAIKSVVLGLAFLAVVHVAESARADQVNVGAAYQTPYDITFYGTHEPAEGAGDFSAAQLSGGGYGPGLTSVPFMYCVDIDHGINLNTTYAAVINTTGVFFGSANLALHSQNSTEAREMAYVIINNAVGATVGDNTMAVQAALWKLEYDGAGPNAINFGLVPGSGNFILNGGPTYQAAYEAIVKAAVLNFGSVNLLTEPRVLFINPLDSNGRYTVQAQISWNPTNSVILPTPVPGTLVMSFILFGMFGMVWSYKRVNQWKAAA